MNNNRTETKNLIKSLKELKFSSHVRVKIARAFIHLDEDEEIDHEYRQTYDFRTTQYPFQYFLAFFVLFLGLLSQQ